MSHRDRTIYEPNGEEMKAVTIGSGLVRRLWSNRVDVDEDAERVVECIDNGIDIVELFPRFLGTARKVQLLIRVDQRSSMRLGFAFGSKRPDRSFGVRGSAITSQ